MPPVLDPVNCKVDGLAFLGLSLTRKSKRGHQDSATHQQSFDLDLVQDRNYEFLASSNDDGWLAGGGEPGPPTSYKLAAKDSAHVEIMRIGTYVQEWGGLPRDFLVEALRKGEILIPEIAIVPTAVVANGDHPPELELRFDMVPSLPNFDDLSTPLPMNWQLRFVQNQLFHKFQFASRFTPGAFHSTILRKAEFRSEKHKQAYFAKTQAICKKWLERGPKPLVPTRDGVASSIEQVRCSRREPKDRLDISDEESRVDREEEEGFSEYYRSGLWLFTDRNTITHQFTPNFLPPYDTSIKKKLILMVLREVWDEKTLQWISLTDKFRAPVPRPLLISPSTKKEEEVKENAQITHTIPETPKEESAEPTTPMALATPHAARAKRSLDTYRSLTVSPETTTSYYETKSVTSPKEQTVKQKKSESEFGLLDPADEDGLAYFLTSLGMGAAAWTMETCGPIYQQFNKKDTSVDQALGRNSVMLNDDTDNEDYRAEERMRVAKPRAVVTGRTVARPRRNNKSARNKNQQQQSQAEIIDVTSL